MNTAVLADFHEALQLVDGNQAAAAQLALASALRDASPEAGGIQRALTVREAAIRLRLNIQTVYQLCRNGRLTSFRAGRAVRIPAAEMERFESEPLADPNPDPDPDLADPDNIEWQD